MDSAPRHGEQLPNPLVPPEQLDGPDHPGDVSSANDDSRWDVFIADDDELDPQPEPGDFCDWTDEFPDNE